jgi:uncharacterized protein (TIGR02117 family)
MTLKKTFKYLGFTILAFLAFIIVYLLAAYGLSKITINEEQNTQADVAIYIKTNGVHTDIVVPIRNPQKDWSKGVRFENTVSKDSSFNYLGMGWGDKGFYLETPTWAELKPSVAFKAATGLSTTAIHATFFKTMAEDSACVKILVSKEQYGRLIKYIDDSFQKDENRQYIYIKTNANYGSDDAFYEANGSYSMFRTCNTWANSGLKYSGQRCSLWTPFDKGIFSKYIKQ